VNDIQVSLRGNVASEPRHVRFDDGNTVTSFRLASTARRFDRERRVWVDRETTYLSVNCRKAAAENAAHSVRKGDPIVVIGRLWERFWSANGKSGQTLEVEADSLGHDLSYGTTDFTRVVRAERVRTSADDQADELAYQLAKDAAAGEGPVTDVSGLTVLDGSDLDGSDLDGDVPTNVLRRTAVG
jgi:single-strand DNA-binding protein